MRERLLYSPQVSLDLDEVYEGATVYVDRVLHKRRDFASLLASS